MKIFLSALESALSIGGGYNWLTNLDKMPFKLKWNLMSYYYLRSKNRLVSAELIRDNSELVMIDSGAHSFQKGARVDWNSYTREYVNFIKNFDRPNVIGYFELDIDSIVSYRRVIEFRKILRSVSDKIIPVWHKNRGVDEYEKMCAEFAGKIVAISGFKNEDITDDQYLMFLKKAKQYGCRVHCLGMARSQILNKTPFDYTDSSSWRQWTNFAWCCTGDMMKKKRINSNFLKNSAHLKELELKNYRQWVRIQEYYYQKWRLYDEDFGGIGWRQIARQ